MSRPDVESIDRKVEIRLLIGHSSGVEEYGSRVICKANKGSPDGHGPGPHQGVVPTSSLKPRKNKKNGNEKNKSLFFHDSSFPDN